MMQDVADVATDLKKEFEKAAAHRREEAKKDARRTFRRRIIALSAAVVAWYIMSHTIIINVPDPIETIRESWWTMQQAYYWQSLGFSVYRVWLGFFIGIIMAVPLGLLMGWNKTIRDLTFPAFEMWRPIPPVRR